MSIRSFDNWNRYLDNHNYPLHGCIQFNVKDGNTIAPIYDSDGTPLNNPIITDEYGRTQHQVFIEEDVVAYYYKYIGNGIWNTQLDIDTSDTTKWSLQYTSENQYSIDGNITTDSPYSVNTIQDLRTIDPSTVPNINGVKYITLLGYNEAGDKEPINYIWDSSSTLLDDGGAVIATNELTGRWIMITPTEHLDVRHYGVFPSNSQNMNDQTEQILRAMTYANSKGLRLFFDTYSDTQTYRYYKLTNITLTPIQIIDVSKGVQFIDTDVTIRSTSKEAFNNDPYFVNGDTNLYSNFAKSSWNIKTLNKSQSNVEATYIIDDNTHSTNITTLQGWNVDVEQNISNYTLTQCNVYGSGLITNSNFITCQMNMKGTLGDSNRYTNVVLDEYMFNGSPLVASVVNCTFDIDDFTHKVTLWNVLYYQQYTEPNIDFKNVNIPNNFEIVGQYTSDRTYSNFNGTGTFNDGMGDYTYTFNNCNGNITVEGNGNNTYIFNNSIVNLDVTFNNQQLTFIFNNCTINILTDLPNATIMANSSTITLKNYYNTVSIKDSSLFGDVSNRRLICSIFSAYSSIVNEEVSAPNILYKDSQINKDIYSTNDGTSIITYIDNCIWNEIQQHISSDTANTIITGAWTNNNATKANPIVFDMTNITNSDASHSYTYSNNKGTFLPKNVKSLFYQYGCFVIDRAVWNATYTSRPEVYNVPHLIAGNYAFPIVDGSNRARFSYGICIPPNWQPDCKFFSIGNTSKKINLTIKIPFRHVQIPDGTSWYNDSTGYNPTLTYTYSDTTIASNVDGATHKLTEFADKIMVGSQYIPYSYNEPAYVPYDSSVVPPTGADNWYFVIEIETLD